MSIEELSTLPDGLVIFVRKDCPTCVEIESVLRQLSKSDLVLTVYSDDPGFPARVSTVKHDRDLLVFRKNEVDDVPTLIHVVDGRAVARTVGWERRSWEALTGTDDLGLDLPDWRPG